MESTEGRIIVLRPGALAAANVIRGDHGHKKTGTELIAGVDSFFFVARGEGTYRINGRSGLLRPNTLIAAPAGGFACTIDDEMELHIVSVREPATAPDDPSTFTPFLERRLSPAEGRHWLDAMQGYAERAYNGTFSAADAAGMKSAIFPYVWQRDHAGARETLLGLFEQIWTQLAHPLTLTALAEGVGYTANYLNDLTRVHTGRPLGRWITDMRMARARAALEQTDLPVADVGMTCGYADPAYFSRVFHRAHGVPPATWRIASRPADARYERVALSIDRVQESEARRASVQRSYSFAS